MRASQPELAVRTSAPAKSEASSQHPLGLAMWCMSKQLAASLTLYSSGSSSIMCRGMHRIANSSQGIGQSCCPCGFGFPLHMM